MRYNLLSLLTLAGLVFSASDSFAQRGKRVTITDVRVGMKAGYDPGEQPDTRYTYLFKAGLWTPVFVDISAGDDPLSPSFLVVETTDSDDGQNNFTIVTPPLEPNESRTFMTYTKPGSIGSEIVVTLR